MSAPSAERDSSVTELWSTAPLTARDRSSAMAWLRGLREVTLPTNPLVGVMLAEKKTDPNPSWVFCPLLRIDELGPVRNNDGNTNLGRRTLKKATLLVDITTMWAVLCGKQARLGALFVIGPFLVVPSEYAGTCAEHRCRDCPLWFNCEGGMMPVCEMTKVEVAEYHFKKRVQSPTTGAWPRVGTSVQSIGVSIASETRTIPSSLREIFLPHFIKD